MRGQISASTRIFKKLNQTVGELALKNKEMVSINFLISYLAQFFDLKGNKKLTEE